jgi:RHS repeat-associated protein
LLALVPLAVQASANNFTYYVNDAVGSPVVAMNQAGDVIWRKTYQPYGKASGKDGDNHIGYTGHVEDKPDLVYAGARYYDPDLVRFLSDDPARFTEKNSMSFNRYAYANNNPYKFVDPDGQEVAAVFDVVAGTLTVTDKDNGNSVTISVFSGGKPWGDPIPDGSYDILEHPKFDFFRLESKDAHYGDDKDEKSGRNEFRLHKPGNSMGCVTAKKKDEWEKARDIIMATKTTSVEVDSKSRNPFSPDKEMSKKYGELEVKQ